MMLRYFDRIERVERNAATVSMLLQTANV